MKKIILTLTLTLSLGFGFNQLKADNLNTDPVQTSIDWDHAGYTYVKVFEDGAIWVYVYDEDGTFIGKFLEEDLN